MTAIAGAKTASPAEAPTTSNTRCALDTPFDLISQGSLSSVETRSRSGDRGPFRIVESVIQVKPGEIVEIRLPKLGDGAAHSPIASFRSGFERASCG
jgi:hypothetical protein